MEETTVYKIDSKNKIRFITISTRNNTVIQTSGIVGSENPVTNISECIGKNIGKSNETSPEEQAILEATAKIKKKLEEGYYLTPEEAQEGDLILPMLAQDFKKHESKVTYPCFVQPKLDGMRALGTNSELKSRKNKSIDNMSHIFHGIEYMRHYILDGELYAHGENFQRNMELIKKYRYGESEMIKYHVYDMIIPDLSFKERYAVLKDFLEVHTPPNVELVPTYEINSKEELMEYHKMFLEQGYEGTMVRHSESSYESNKRSYSLLKFKDFQDLACEIIDVQPSEKRPEQGIFICRLENGIEFGCGMKFSHEQRSEFLINKIKYIGQIAEIRFFEYSSDGIPRFPVCVGLRIDL